VIPEISSRTDRQTHKHTQTCLSQYVRTPYGSEVLKVVVAECTYTIHSVFLCEPPSTSVPLQRHPSLDSDAETEEGCMRHEGKTTEEKGRDEEGVKGGKGMSR